MSEVFHDALLSCSAPFVIAAVCYLALINLAAFLLMRRDKRLAKKQNARRIPEKSLFLIALLGGSAGAIAGMWHFRHKTKHWYFVMGMPAILTAQLALLFFLLSQ